MRMSVREVMHKAIIDYAALPRTTWMQKWPGQCVLNASQLHWTKETEEFLKERGANGPKAMLERQVHTTLNTHNSVHWGTQLGPLLSSSRSSY